MTKKPISVKEYNEKVKRREKIHRQYWESFLSSPGILGEIPIERSVTKEYMCYPFRNTDEFHVAAVLPVTEPGLRVEFSMKGPNRADHFRWFLDRRDAIEAALGAEPELDWLEQNIPSDTQCQIGRTIQEFKRTDTESWPAQHKWLADQVCLFRAKLGPMVRELLGIE